MTPERSIHTVVHCGYRVDLHAENRRGIRIFREDSLIAVWMEDDGPKYPSSQFGTGIRPSSTVFCRKNGTISLRVRNAPAPVLITRELTVTPVDRQRVTDVTCAPGDRILLLSNRACQDAPFLVDGIMAMPPARVRAADPVELLLRLLREAPEAAGALITVL